MGLLDRLRPVTPEQIRAYNRGKRMPGRVALAAQQKPAESPFRQAKRAAAQRKRRARG
jgi:hypothetical protein